MLLNSSSQFDLQVRRAIESDCKLFWHWVNDPDVRQNAFNSDFIPFETHQEWFLSKLKDPYTTIYVIENNNCPIGQVRFEKQEERYKIDYSLTRDYRGLGLGKKMLSLAVNTFVMCQNLRGIIAEVFSENIRSNKIFESLGFQEITGINANVRFFVLPIHKF